MNTQPTIALEQVALPAIGRPQEPRPELSATIYGNRLARLRERMRERGLEALVVYGDREHFANVHYLTNYDPRFEETVLVVLPAGRPVLFVGNEGMGYSHIARLEVDRRLYQALSLMGQPREKVRPFDQLLREAGLKSGWAVGAAGWKYFGAAEFDRPEETLDLPDYVAGAVRRAVGPAGRVTNETSLFLDPETGLRNVHEPEQLADFEWMSTLNSQSVLDAIRALRPGMTENEAFIGLKYNGLPLACYCTCSSGEMVLRYGMASASSRVIRLGDPMFVTMAYQGANTCRFGWIGRGPEELPAPVRDYVEVMAVPYARALAAWYGSLRVGATGDEMHRAASEPLHAAGLHLGLNAGHQIAYDEWTHSLVAAGSRQKLVSGMYWQCDFFPTRPTPHFGAFAEDGLAIAAAPLRDLLRRRYPAMWARIETRRRFMQDMLGIRLSADVLPFANFQAAIMPFLLAPDRCLVLRPQERGRRGSTKTSRSA